METLYHLHLMMSTKLKSFAVIATCFVGIVSCNRQSPEMYNCGVDGIVTIGGSSYEHPNGIMVSITNESDRTVKHTAVTDKNGKFSFRDLESGSYIIDAVKEGYRWGLMIDDGIMNPYDRLIELTNNKIKNLQIQLWGADYGTTDVFDLDLTDLDGRPLTKIVIPNGATTISFRLFNGTQTSHGWELWYNLVSIGAERVFLSFNVSDGVLDSGDNVVLIGFINPNIFNIGYDKISGFVSIVDYYSGKSPIKNIDVCVDK